MFDPDTQIYVDGVLAEVVGLYRNPRTLALDALLASEQDDDVRLSVVLGPDLFDD